MVLEHKKNKMKNIFSPKWPKKGTLTILELKFLFFIIKRAIFWQFEQFELMTLLGRFDFTEGKITFSNFFDFISVDVRRHFLFNKVVPILKSGTTLLNKKFVARRRL